MTTSPPSIGYISDACCNNAETLFNHKAPNMASLIDLVNIVQSSVLNEYLVTSTLAIERNSLLQKLPFADSFRVTQSERSGDMAYLVQSPKGLDAHPDAQNEVLIDTDENGELCANSAGGELFLACAWSEMLTDNPMLGAFFQPENAVPSSALGDNYLTKFAANMFFMTAKLGLQSFDSEQSAHHLNSTADEHLHLYGVLARRLIHARDTFDLDLTCSVLEQPMFGMSIASELSQPLIHLQKYDDVVAQSIMANREAAFETWRFPAVGAAVLGRCKSLDELPKQIIIAREKLLKPRQEIRRRNQELIQFEKEMALGNDKHLNELNRLKFELERALGAFGSESEYRQSLAAFPISERVWWLPKILIGALDAVKSPEKILEDISKEPWLKRQSYLRYVKGLPAATSYLKKVDEPIMEHLIKGVLKWDFGKAKFQSHILARASELTERCCAAANPAEISLSPILSFGDVELMENQFWRLAVSDEQIRNGFLFANSVSE